MQAAPIVRSSQKRAVTMKRYPKLVWCVAGLLCGSLAFARTPDPTAVVPEARLSAKLVLSDEPDELLSDWATGTPRVPVRSTESIPRGAPIVAFVFFTGCRPNPRGLCNASVDFTILRPDGSVYESFSDRDLWKRKHAPPRGAQQMAAEYVGVVIEPDDPLGSYEVHASVHDLNAGTTLELMRTFTATAKQAVERP
jgi:hypothetical protein